MARINWKTVIPEAVTQAKGYRDEFGVAPTLRGVYYRLVSVEALPNTRSAYKGLSNALTKARHSGQFPWSLMADNTRGSTGAGSENKVESAIHAADTEVRDNLQNLKRAFETIMDPSVNFHASKWAGQPKRVVVAIEKDAIMGAVQNVLKGMDVEIFPLRGYTSTTHMRQIAGSIQRLNRKCDEVHLVIITDYDPSGEDMVRDLEERISYDFGTQCTAEKILLTKPQIQEYDLPAIPDDVEEMAKMQRDPRFRNWIDGFYRVELDAMAAIEPAAFRKIVRSAVTQYFDKDIWDQNRVECNEANTRAEEDLRELYEKLETVHNEVLEKIAEIEGDN